MIKSVLKEIAIIILLTAAIVLLLGILFYDYMPTSKVIPAKAQEYAIDTEVKAELEKELNNSNSEEIVKTYLLDATDLAAYERTNEYNKGKQNPFSRVSSGSGGSGSSGSSTSDGASGGSGDAGTPSAGNSGSSGSTSDSGDSGSTSSNTNNNSSSTTTNTSSGTYLNIVGK